MPTGYYDREAARWIAAPNGVVIKLVGREGGVAHLDTDGDGAADTTPASTTPSAQARRRSTRPAELWRVAIDALHAVGLQLALRPARRRRPPGQGGPDGGDGDGDTATPAARSSAARSRRSARSADRRHAVHAALRVRPRARPPQRDDARHPADGRGPARHARARGPQVEVAGPTITQRVRLCAEPRGRVHLGRQGRLRADDPGRQPADVKLSYVYPTVYRGPVAFGVVRGPRRLAAHGQPRAPDVTVPQKSTVPVGGLPRRRARSAGWNLDVHQTYDPVGQTLYRRRRHEPSAEGQNFDVIRPRRPGARVPEGLVSRAGRDVLHRRHRRERDPPLRPGGAPSVFAGTGDAGLRATAGRGAARFDPPRCRARSGRRPPGRRPRQPPGAQDRTGGVDDVAGTGARLQRRRRRGRGRHVENRPASPSTPTATLYSSTAATTRCAGSPDGRIATVAGTGAPGGLATGAWPPPPDLRQPRDVALRGPTARVRRRHRQPPRARARRGRHRRHVAGDGPRPRGDGRARAPPAGGARAVAPGATAAPDRRRRQRGGPLAVLRREITTVAGDGGPGQRRRRRRPRGPGSASRRRRAGRRRELLRRSTPATTASAGSSPRCRR